MGQQEETYMAEKIVNKRIRKGKTEYFVKWENWPSDQNTWEPRSHLTNCLDLIDDFERERREENSLNKSKNGTPYKRNSKSEGKNTLNKSDLNDSSTAKRGRPSKGSKTPDSSKSKNLAGVTLNDCEESTRKGSDKHGFQRKLKPKEIVGAVENEDGVYCFLIKWENCNETDLVPAKEAHKECPQLVIQFYEKRISWKSKTK